MTFYSYLFVHTFAAFGVAFVLGYSKITLWARVSLSDAGPIGRFFVELLECPGCLGWHLGFWSGACFVRFSLERSRIEMVSAAIAFAFYTAGTNFLLGRAAGLIEDK